MNHLFKSVCFCDHILNKCGEPFFDILNMTLQLNYLIFCLLSLQVIILSRTFDYGHQTSLDGHFESVHVNQLILRHVIVIFEYLIDLLPHNLHISVGIWWQVHITRYLPSTTVPIIDISDASTTRTFFTFGWPCSIAPHYRWSLCHRLTYRVSRRN